MPDQVEIDTSPEKTSKNRIWRCCGCFLIPVAILVLLLWLPQVSHNIKLWSFDRSFTALKHPTCSSMIDHHREVGLLIGNGDHCDYYVGELRSYKCSKAEISTFYNGKTIHNPITGKRQEVELAFIDNGKLKGYLDTDYEFPNPVLDIAYEMKQKHDQNRYYVVYILDPGYDVEFDIRGM